MNAYIFLQHYWWFVVSLLGALLVFLLFVQEVIRFLCSVWGRRRSRKKDDD